MSHLEKWGEKSRGKFLNREPISSSHLRVPTQASFYITSKAIKNGDDRIPAMVPWAIPRILPDECQSQAAWILYIQIDFFEYVWQEFFLFFSFWSCPFAKLKREKLPLVAFFMTSAQTNLMDRKKFSRREFLFLPLLRKKKSRSVTDWNSPISVRSSFTLWWPPINFFPSFQLLYLHWDKSRDSWTSYATRAFLFSCWSRWWICCLRKKELVTQKKFTKMNGSRTKKGRRRSTFPFQLIIPTNCEFIPSWWKKKEKDGNI